MFNNVLERVRVYKCIINIRGREIMKGSRSEFGHENVGLCLYGRHWAPGPSVSADP